MTDGRDIKLEALQQHVSVLQAKLNNLEPTPGPSAPTLAPAALTPLPVESPARSPPRPEDNNADPDEEDGSTSVADALAERFKAFTLGFVKNQFFGASSGYMLMKNAVTTKEEAVGRSSVSDWRRPEYWNMRPWELPPASDHPSYTFPAPDLIASLLQLYFDAVHPTFPLLHQPSFERAVSDGLHEREYQFGAVVLAVLALGSRYSDDPRVFVPGTDNSKLSSGWTFFNQVQVVRKSLHDEPSLYEVQLYCVSSAAY
ncbi:hypothetical protein C8R43DRAFT_1006382 [Mycena crocata]|nr:hypothetical protein C8R43DRAFT_1006382 [Mycena crocata]